MNALRLAGALSLLGLTAVVPPSPEISTKPGARTAVRRRRDATDGVGGADAADICRRVTDANRRREHARDPINC